MQCALRIGSVVEITSQGETQELKVAIGNEIAKAINYPNLTSTCQIGDVVTLNTTAIELDLGTGGWHYVLAIQGREQPLSGSGHIMKLRYTPLQGHLLSVEESESPYHAVIDKNEEINKMPVAVGSLHSMLAPFAIGFQYSAPTKKLVYLMSDGAALPIAFSKIVRRLQERKLIDKTITFGHAFGGDFEAVNIYSALLAAKHVCRADAAVVLMGPGVVGTGTKWGTTALEQGVYLDAVQHLTGQAVAILRMSEADKRMRHKGISHHSQTALQIVSNPACQIPVPEYCQDDPYIIKQLQNFDFYLSWVSTEGAFTEMTACDLELSTMGRTPSDDPLFFHSALAAGIWTGQVLNN